MDRSPDVELSPDGLAMDQFTLGRQGVRSDASVTPGSGIFYFEAARHVDGQYMALGVATAAVPLDAELGATPQLFGVDSGGSVGYGGRVEGFDPATTHYGFIVDYRRASPVVHTIALLFGQPAIVLRAEMTAVREPLFIFLGGLRRLVGFQTSINPGNDVTNFPFRYDPRALMNATGIAGAAELVLGWGDSYAGPADQPPSVSVSADQTVPLGAAVTVSATASDAEDGSLTSAIRWEDLATPVRPRLTGTGGTFTFTPDALGLHELRASVTDSTGHLTTASVRITVSGSLPTFNPVRLELDPLSGAGIQLTADGLGARFTADAKMGVRANQGLLGGFQYFEIRRERPPINLGGGLVIRGGNLDPYHPRDVPPSCSVNVLGGSWRNLMYSASFPPELVNMHAHYGFAVDYRGSFPTVYIILGGRIVDTIAMPDVTVPVYPMLYGNPTGSAPGTADETINFGARPFQYDARAILQAAGVDVTGFVARWGG